MTPALKGETALKFFFSLQGQGKKEEFQISSFKCVCPSVYRLPKTNFQDFAYLRMSARQTIEAL